MQMISFVGKPCTGKTTTFQATKEFLKNEKNIQFYDEPARKIMNEKFPNTKIEDLSPYDNSELQIMIFEYWTRLLDQIETKNKIVVTDSSPMENVYVYARGVVPDHIQKSMTNILCSKMKHIIHNIILFNHSLPLHHDGLRHENEQEINRIGSAIEDEIFKQNLQFYEMDIYNKNPVKNINKRTEKSVQLILATQNLLFKTEK